LVSGKRTDVTGEISRLRERLRGERPGVASLHAIGERILGMENEADRIGLPTQRVAVLGALSCDFLLRGIACAVLAEGVFPLLYQAPYDAITAEIIDPGSGLRQFRPELTVIAGDRRGVLSPDMLNASGDEVAADRAARVAGWRELWARLQAGGSRILQHVSPPPPMRGRGLAERLAVDSAYRRNEELNNALIEASAGAVGWIDLDRLAAEIGYRAWYSSRLFHTSRLAFDPRHLPDYVDLFRGAWRLQCGRAKKVLAVDLDNTLWGGVIGDDGVEGIVLGPDGGAAGVAFQEWQRYVRDLSSRGVILAACSKNEPDIAAYGFAHPASILSRGDFAAFECSWGDKASGLRAVAASVNVALDSIVFVDDNPAETAQVACALPEVETVCLGDDPALFIERLEAGHWFDHDRYTNEDAQRAAAYRGRDAATAAQAAASDMDSYLASLEMTGILRQARPEDLLRLAQLQSKTNQFNLTTRRYGAAELEAFLADPAVYHSCLWLRDRFADHGLTASLIAVEDGDALRIDSWLMSCRIFGRTAEQAMLIALVDAARRRGVGYLLGEYLPTERNGVVADLYERLGFVAASDNQRWWRCPLDAPLPNSAISVTIS
jgi:FkbH-like protein